MHKEITKAKKLPENKSAADKEDKEKKEDTSAADL